MGEWGRAGPARQTGGCAPLVLEGAGAGAMASAGGRSRAREARILHFGGGRAESWLTAPGWSTHPHPAALPRAPSSFSRGEAGRRLFKWTPRCASHWFELVPSFPQRLPTKWRTPPPLPPPPPPPPAAPPGAISAADMAPSPAAGGGSKASSAQEALPGGAGCGAAGQAPSLGDVNSPFSLWDRFHYPCSVHHGNGPRFKALVKEGKEWSGTPRRTTASPYGSAAGDGAGEASPHPTAGAVAPAGTERTARTASAPCPRPAGSSRLGGTENFCKLPLSKSGAGSISATLRHR